MSESLDNTCQENLFEIYMNNLAVRLTTHSDHVVGEYRLSIVSKKNTPKTYFARIRLLEPFHCVGKIMTKGVNNL